MPRAAIIVLALPIGAILGDMLGSVIKRRLDRERGSRTPILDQYDFVIGTVIVMMVVAPEWFVSRFISGWNILGILTILVVTPALHRTVNIIGYRMGKKKEPW